MNTFKFVRYSKNDVRIRSLLDKMVFIVLEHPVLKCRRRRCGRKLIDDANKYCFVIRKAAALDFLRSIPKKWKGYIIKVEAPQSVLQNYGLRKHKLVEFPVETVIFSSILPAVLSNLD